MPGFEAIEIETADGVLNAPVAFPAKGDGPWPAVLACDTLPGQIVRQTGVMAALTEQLPGRGIAVVQIEPLPGGARPTDLAAVVEQLQAVFRAMLTHDRIESTAIGLLAVGLGAIPASGFARRTEGIARMAFVNPTTATTVTTLLAKPEGAQPLINADDAGGDFLASLGRACSEDDAAFHHRPSLILHTTGADQPIPPSGSLPYHAAFVRVGHGIQRELIARTPGNWAGAEDSEHLNAIVARLADFFLERDPWSSPAHDAESAASPS